MTRAQKKWLKILRETGFVERGGWSRGQRNRPLRALVRMGLAAEDFGPKGSLLMVDGFVPVGEFVTSKPPKSETLSGVVKFLNGN